jgi:hypothetical protein
MFATLLRPEASFASAIIIKDGQPEREMEYEIGRVTEA